jgi:hypothetical protein
MLLSHMTVRSQPDKHQVVCMPFSCVLQQLICPMHHHSSQLHVLYKAAHTTWSSHTTATILLVAQKSSCVRSWTCWLGNHSNLLKSTVKVPTVHATLGHPAHSQYRACKGHVARANPPNRHSAPTDALGQVTQCSTQLVVPAHILPAVSTSMSPQAAAHACTFSAASAHPRLYQTCNNS